MLNNNLMFAIISLIIIGIFAFIIIMFIRSFSSKASSKMMGKSLKTLKTMMEDNTEVFQELSKMSVNLQKNVLDENEDVLKEIATKKANINKDAVEITAEAIKKGLNK